MVTVKEQGKAKKNWGVARNQGMLFPEVSSCMCLAMIFTQPKCVTFGGIHFAFEMPLKKGQKGSDLIETADAQTMCNSLAADLHKYFGDLEQHKADVSYLIGWLSIWRVGRSDVFDAVDKWTKARTTNQNVVHADVDDTLTPLWDEYLARHGIPKDLRKQYEDQYKTQLASKYAGDELKAQVKKAVDSDSEFKRKNAILSAQGSVDIQFNKEGHYYVADRRLTKVSGRSTEHSARWAP